jgi:hypothetical protein
MTKKPMFAGYDCHFLFILSASLLIVHYISASFQNTLTICILSIGAGTETWARKGPEMDAWAFTKSGHEDCATESSAGGVGNPEGKGCWHGTASWD